ncbi:MAG: cyclodeaminase/cyclohydrolase family protein [Christensenellales bacterium]|jgi:formiminotetrahydrofolate cyclodeaminase
MLDFQQMTVANLSALTASNAPVPGGGSISAMTGAYAASLVCMVAKLTLGRAKYEAAQDIMKQADAQAEALRLSLLEGITKDSASFDTFMQALALPKDTDEEKQARQAAMQAGLKSACEVPLASAQNIHQVLKLALDTVKHGNANALSDGLVAALLARSALIGAISNVRINLPGIKDEAFAARMREACDHLEQEAHRLENEAMHAAKNRES